MPTASPASLSVLLTNIGLDGRSGTEIVTRDLALGLLRAGHRPRVYAPRLGPIAEELRSASIPVTDDIATIRERPDVIHGHHTIQTGVAAARFPATPAIFVCHDFTTWHDRPPRLPSIGAYVAISDTFAERLTIEGAIDPGMTEVILNGVDTARFMQGPPLPARPRRALAFVKDLGNRDAFEGACAERGISLDLVGRAVGRLIEAPEAVMLQYDLVFASALTAIEAMATGRAVIVAEGRGLAGYVDAAAYAAWRRENFGARTLRRPVTVEALLPEIDRYDAAGARAVGERVRQEANLEAWTARYVDLYRRVIAARAAAGAIPADQTAQAMAALLQAYDPIRILGDWAEEHARLVDEIAQLRDGLMIADLGQTVTTNDDRRLDLDGFHYREPWGVWSARPQCRVRFRLSPDQTLSRITVAVQPLFAHERQLYDLTCRLGDSPLGVITLDAADETSWRPRTFDLPQPAGGGEHCLAFATGQCLSLEGDGRELGFGLLSLRFD